MAPSRWCLAEGKQSSLACISYSQQSYQVCPVSILLSEMTIPTQKRKKRNWDLSPGRLAPASKHSPTHCPGPGGGP